MIIIGQPKWEGDNYSAESILHVCTMEARPPRCRRPFRNAQRSAAGLAKHPADMVAPTQLHSADGAVASSSSSSSSSSSAA
eukprot:1958546-Alexandrium_andersonii.AAC.1